MVEIHPIDHAHVLPATVAAFIEETVAIRLRAAPHCWLALAGGSTPKPIYERLGHLPWPRISALLTDERCVPATDPASNYRMICTALGPDAAKRVIELRHAADDHHLAAAAYATQVQQAIDTGLSLCLLGLGDDGHTASLFPTDPLAASHPGLVVAVDIPRFGPRISLTLSAINAADQVAFVVSGGSKATAVAQLIARDPRFPSSLVLPRSGHVHLFADRDALAHVS